MHLNGNRKLIAFVLSLLICGILSFFAINGKSEGLIGVIGSIWGGAMGLMGAFVAGNVGEHRAKSGGEVPAK